MMIRKMSFGCILGMLLAICSLDAFAAGPITLTNPGFTNGLTGWQNWGNTSVVTDGSVPSGYAACSGTGGGGVGQDIASQVAIGATYTMTAYAKVLATGDSTQLGIQFKDVNGNMISSQYLSPDTTSYQQYSVTFTVPSGTAQAIVYEWKDAGSTQYCVDDFSVSAQLTLTNPGFTNGLTGWQNWGNTSVVTDSSAPSGYAACSGTGGGGVGQDIASQVAIGATYTMTAYAEVLATGDSTQLGIQFKDVNGNMISSQYLSPDTTSYQQYSVTFTVPSGTAQAIVYEWKDAGSTQLCVDNFAVQTSGGYVVAINSAGAAAGNYAADVDYNGGNTSSVSATIDTSAVTNPAPQAVYQTQRYDANTYTIPGLAAGASYTVRLHFAETNFTAAGQREFNVSINGTQVLTNFDIYATTGAEDKAVVETFTTTANGSGQIVIAFTNGAVNYAAINGIEILSSNGQAAFPSFSPQGGSYSSAQSVTISDSTPGATIYYTTDGSTPTTSSAQYSSAINVSTSETLNAIATAPGYAQSAVGSAAYTINLAPAATPTFSPLGGNYTSAQSVTISDSTPSATIYYTTDGSTPTTGSPQYTSAINVSASETINAIATASGYAQSAVGSASYSISPGIAVTNSGFTNGLTGWVNWGNTTVTTDSSAPSGYAACTGTGAGGIGQDILSELTVGDTYTVTGYAKVLDTGDSTQLGIQFKDSSGNTIAYRIYRPDTTSYQPYSVTFTVPTGASQAFVYEWKDAGSTQLCVDNFSVQRTTIPSSRNAFIQPFASNSIWNYPIGLGMGSLVSQGTGSHGGAQYGWSGGGGPVYEKLSSTTLSSVYDDEEENMWAPDASPRQVYSNNVAWNPSGATNTDRCNATQTATGNYEPIPATANYENNPGGAPNAATSILQSDRHTIHHTQPGVVCGVGGIFTSEYWSWPSSDLLTDGTVGSHGGSGLSEVGDEIRWFDLRPPQGAGGNSPFIEPNSSGQGVGDVMRHAIGLNVGGLANNWTSQTYWPATNNDGAREGLLLALLPTFDPNSLSTPIGRSMAWTLQNYGGYIVDQTAAGAWSVMGEWSYGPNTSSVLDFPPGRMETTTDSDWGYSFSTLPWGQASTTPLGSDMITIWNNLYVVTNNSSTTIGGDTSSGVAALQDFLPAPSDPGQMSAVPTISAQTMSVLAGATADGSVIGTVQASSSPYFWSLSGTGASLFNIDKWGVIRVAYGQTITSSPSSYTLTVTGTNVIGQGSGTITINVQ